MSSAGFAEGSVQSVSDAVDSVSPPPVSPFPPSRLRGRSVDLPGCHPDSPIEGWPGKRPGDSCGSLVVVDPPHSSPSSPVALRLPRSTLLSLERTPSPLRVPSSSYADSLDCPSGPLYDPIYSLHQQPRGAGSKSYDGSAREGALAAPSKRMATFGFEDEQLPKEAILSSKPQAWLQWTSSELIISEGKSDHHGARPSSMVAPSGGSHSSLMSRASLNGASTVQQPVAHRHSLSGTVQSALRPSASGSAAQPAMASGPSFMGADKLIDQLSRMQTAMGE